MHEILSIKPIDAAKLANFQAQTFIEAYRSIHTMDDMMAYCTEVYTYEAALADIIDANTLCFGAFNQQKELEGYYTIKQHALPDIKVPQNTTSELKRLYIGEQNYKSGLGSKLYHHAIKEIIKQGSDTVWLCVSNRNYRAQTFYQKRGFNFTGQGPELKVGKDTLTSSYLSRRIIP
jgi:GNAT superfamily N-acetyltransferase